MSFATYGGIGCIILTFKPGFEIPELQIAWISLICTLNEFTLPDPFNEFKRLGCAMCSKRTPR